MAGDDRFAGGALAKFSFSLVVCYGVGFVSKSLFATWICNRSFLVNFRMLNRGQRYIIICYLLSLLLIAIIFVLFFPQMISIGIVLQLKS